ncbi:MAG TPA: hypothetical protein VGW39_12210 [Chthoniobacterales bacterium]|nr:hypothetical protein [Chthoniobacterales bacterium]
MQLIQLLTIGLMLGMTFVIYKALGPARKTLLYTRDEKGKWDAFIKDSVAGGWLTIANVVGTLTSLAGAYVFFIGSSKLFGYWIFICSLSIVLGAWVTNVVTKRIMDSPRLAALLESPDQTGGVIASVFWDEDLNSRRTARLVKWVSILNLGALLWMEFSVFALIAERLLHVESFIWAAPILLFACCFTVVLFTLRYGLRGFVFADLFQSPMILLAAVGILGGCIVFASHNWGSLPPIKTIAAPWLSTRACVLFALHNICLNGLLMLVTESHWLRLWIFRERETRKLIQSSLWTGVVWVPLSVIGFMAYYASGKDPGLDAVAGLLDKLNDFSIVFSAVFWIGGIAALFSTTDATFYSLLVVHGFDSNSGKLRDRVMANIRPGVTAVVISAAVAGCYAVLFQWLKLPIEKFLFIVFPLPLNLFPAFVRAFRGLPQRPWYIVIALLLYLFCAVKGLRQPQLQFEWTLAAALVPIGVGFIAAFGRRPPKADIKADA